MDSSWQTKCDSTFQLSTPPMVSSATQEARGQVTSAICLRFIHCRLHELPLLPYAHFLVFMECAACAGMDVLF